MRTQDLTPAMIGQRIRIQSDDGLQIEGHFNNLDVITEYNIVGVHYLAGLVVQLNNHELRLTGNETVTTLDK